MSKTIVLNDEFVKFATEMGQLLGDETVLASNSPGVAYVGPTVSEPHLNLDAIKELRARTHLGLKTCKDALAEASGDIEAAIVILQKKTGLKKADDLIVPTEGQVHASVDTFGFIVELNCQTDFAARSDVFCNFLSKLVVNNHENLGKGNLNTDEVSRILGEKIVVRRQKWMGDDPRDTMMVAYNHGGKIAVLLSLSVPEDADRSKVRPFAEDLAMHIAATKTYGLTRNDVNPEWIKNARAAYELDAGSKPEPMRARIVEGKMNKWFTEFSTMDQESVVHPKKTNGMLLDEAMKSAGFMFNVKNCIRWERGEAIV